MSPLCSKLSNGGFTVFSVQNMKQQKTQENNIEERLNNYNIIMVFEPLKELKS